MVGRMMGKVRWWFPAAVVHWSFMAGSVAYLGWLGLGELDRRLIDGLPGQTVTRAFFVENTDGVWSAPGLSYAGVGGAALALAEAAAVLAFIGLSLFPGGWPRLVGKLGSLAWVSLWAGSAAVFADKSGGGAAWLLAGLYAIPLVCTAVVVARPRARRKKIGTPPTPSKKTRPLDRVERTKLRNIPSGEAIVAVA